MQAKAKSNSVCTSVYDKEHKQLVFTVLGGFPVLNLPIDKVSNECLFEAQIRGLNQSCINAAALPRDKTTGKSATAAEKYAAMIRAKVATDAEVANEIANKLAAKRGIDRTAALKVWALVGPVGDAIAEIKAERAKEIAKNANLDVAALLAEAMAAEDEEGEGEEGGDTDNLTT
jgi:hypothetical protein